MRTGLLPVILATLAVLPGCHFVPKPPTPVLSGPDTGWAQAPVAFTVAFTQKSGGWTTAVNFDWGDGGSLGGCPLSDSYGHTYTEPGAYAARCCLSNLRLDPLFQAYDRKDGDWSAPCTVYVLPDTLTHPAGISRAAR